ncbi:hypothetical protein L2E82_00666 [Cichorium intybus]|uniref:Uncharacterized protein n=1 Tax=Cichorium intybus TaxID=13427 RepID=A0ACB9GXU3_CICIN|nr:hypothetical protein L2E82_00666 [Cichorium intybus]
MFLSTHLVNASSPSNTDSSSFDVVPSAIAASSAIVASSAIAASLVVPAFFSRLSNGVTPKHIKVSIAANSASKEKTQEISWNSKRGRNPKYSFGFVPGGSISSLLGKFGPFPEAVGVQVA